MNVVDHVGARDAPKVAVAVDDRGVGARRADVRVHVTPRQPPQLARDPGLCCARSRLMFEVVR